MRGIEQYLQVDAATLGALKYQGTWDASTNTPTLTSSVGVQGQYYVVSVAGSTNLNGETAWQVGDWAVFNGSVWQKVDGGSTGLLTTLTVTGNTYLATTSGDVGIGTTSPTSKLEVLGNGVFRVDGAGSTTPLVLRNNNTASVQAVKLGFDSSGAIKSSINAAVYGNDYMTFNVGSDTERMRIDASGNVGIGTTSPARKLEVNGAIRLADAQRVEWGTDYWIVGDSGGAMIFGTNNTERMRITSTGDVGIGTGSPLSPLHVKGTTNGNLLVRAASSAASGLTGLGLSSINDAASDVADMALQAKNFNFVTDNTIRATLNSSGNVGIGTSSPGAKLEVSDATTGELRVTGGGQGFQIYTQAGATTLGTYTNIPLIVRTNTNEQMRITSAGDVGIGTSLPGAKLDVYGTGSQTVSVRAATSGDARFYAECAGTNSGWMQYTRSLQALQWSANGSTQHMTLDSAGNLGLGVTPSAIWASGKALQISTGFTAMADAANAYLSANSYYNGTNWIYLTTNGASREVLSTSGIQWHIAPSGTAGNAISFTQAMTLDSSGNLGLGVTPSASTIAQFEGGSNLLLVGRGNAYLSNNVTYNGGWKYIATAVAAQYNISGAEHRWYNAASGTAGNTVSWTQAMTLDANGNLGIGTTSPSVRLHASGASQLVRLQNDSAYIQFANTANTDTAYIQQTASIFNIISQVNGAMVFGTNSAERARIPAAGGMVVGTAALATTATDGFLYVPTCAGTPTGTPTTQTGTAPIVVDTTNNKLYFYSGGQWRDAGP